MNSTTEAPAPSAAEADALAAESAGLSRAIDIIDPGTLSELLERSVTITHARLKPGRSVVVAHTDAHGSHGWTTLTSDPDKFRKAQQRAADAGDQITVHQQSAGTYLFSGSIWSDPPLAKELAEAAQTLDRREGGPVSWEILRYNPRRRVVAAVDVGKAVKVVRVLPGSARHLLRTAGRWRQLGLPVTTVRPLGRRGSAVITPLWGYSDLSRTPYEPAAVSTGAAVSRLHAAPRRGRGRNLPQADPRQAAAALGRVAPWLAGRAEQLALRCAARMAPAVSSATAEIHGDLSPDQVLMAAENSHKIRIIDLDRAGGGHPMRDIGSWTATCRHSGHTSLIDAFLSGYHAHALLNQGQLNVWESYAHLSRATDFFRHREPDWPAHTINALNLAEEALDR